MLRYLGLTLVLLGITALVPAHAASNAALTGKVTSAAEGPMEGVVVSANRQGSTVTVSVVSDHEQDMVPEHHDCRPAMLP